MSTRTLLLVALFGCTEVRERHSESLAVPGLRLVRADIERGTLTVEGGGAADTVDAQVVAWGRAGSRNNARAQARSNDWSFLSGGGVVEVYTASPVGTAGVDVDLEAPTDVGVDALVWEGHVHLANLRGHQVVTADGIRGAPLVGSVNLFARSDGIDVDLIPEAGSRSTLETVGADLVVGLPAGFDYELTLLFEPRHGAELPDLGFDQVATGEGVWQAWSGAATTELVLAARGGRIVVVQLRPLE